MTEPAETKTSSDVSMGCGPPTKVAIATQKASTARQQDDAGLFTMATSVSMPLDKRQTGPPTKTVNEATKDQKKVKVKDSQEAWNDV